MTTTDKIRIGCVAALVLLFVVCWQRSREDVAKTIGEVKVQQQVAAKAEQHIEQTAAADQAYRKQIERRQAALTPQTALAELQAHLPASAPIEPVQVMLADKLPDEVRANLPASPSYLCLTETQQKAIASDQLACEADRHSLAARESDVTDLHTQLAARTAEAAAWERAAKGGSKWRRFGRVLKLTGCAAGGAAAGAIFSKQLPAAPAIGGAAGVVGCSLF